MKINFDYMRVMKTGRRIMKDFGSPKTEFNIIKALVAFLFFLMFIFILLISLNEEAQSIQPAEIDTDKWANAIFLAEGGYKATYLYGIRSIPYKDEAQARQYCKNTVYNTLVKYRVQRCSVGESDIDCMSRRYCPVGSNTDNGTCKYWKKNVLYFLKEEL